LEIWQALYEWLYNQLTDQTVGLESGLRPAEFGQDFDSLWFMAPSVITTIPLDSRNRTAMNDEVELVNKKSSLVIVEQQFGIRRQTRQSK
jgi:hypothetical protein